MKYGDRHELLVDEIRSSTELERAQEGEPMSIFSWRELVVSELAKAEAEHKPYASAHEAYAVILEELDEFWEEVRMKRQFRNKENMLHELVQIATTAERAAYNLGLIHEVLE